jgi:streptogramin lyase
MRWIAHWHGAKRARRIGLLVAVLAALLQPSLPGRAELASDPVIASPPGTVSTIPLPPGIEGLGGLASGWDGNLWFTARFKSNGAGLIGRVSGVDGQSPTVTTFPSGDDRATSQPSQIVMGRQYDMWFTDPGTDRIGRITFDAQGAPIIESFSLPAYPGTPQLVPIFPRDHLWDLAVGSDGNVWYATTRYFRPCPGCDAEDYPVIGKISDLDAATPTIEEFAAPDSGGQFEQFTGVAAGPDGRLWYSRFREDSTDDTGLVGRVSNLTAATPTIEEFKTPFLQSGCKFAQELQPGRMTAGPDGQLWFGSRTCGAGYLVRVTTDPSPTPPTFTPFAVHPPQGGDFCDPAPNGITAGADSAIWISRGVEPCTSEPGSSGVLVSKTTFDSAFSIHPADAFPSIPLVSGPDSGLWGVGTADSPDQGDAIVRFPVGVDAPQFVNPAQIFTVAQQNSQINVSGVPGAITSVTVHLRGLNHSDPSNLDVLLTSPDGRRSVVLSDVSAGASARAAHPISISNAPGTVHSFPETGPLVSGRYRPTNYSAGPADSFPGVPRRAVRTTFCEFVGSNPNGTWTLQVVDDEGVTPSYGSLTHGWGLSFQTGAVGPRSRPGRCARGR